MDGKVLRITTAGVVVVVEEEAVGGGTGEEERRRRRRGAFLGWMCGRIRRGKTTSARNRYVTGSEFGKGPVATPEWKQVNEKGKNHRAEVYCGAIWISSATAEGSGAEEELVVSFRVSVYGSSFRSP